jgi:23S rRNA (cytosine1962-C5)-methyltransferase
VDEAHFGEEVRRGVEKVGRQARILRRSGAAPDHPVHPSLPESAYLKAELLALD